METPLPARAGGPSLVRGLTLLGTVALCVGNMVGTSVYTLPALLAVETGPLGILAWVVTAAGYLFVALVYASLGTRYPETGGPYVFAREAPRRFNERLLLVGQGKIEHALSLLRTFFQAFELGAHRARDGHSIDQLSAQNPQPSFRG